MLAKLIFLNKHLHNLDVWNTNNNFKIIIIIYIIIFKSMTLRWIMSLHELRGVLEHMFWVAPSQLCCEVMDRIDHIIHTWTNLFLNGRLHYSRAFVDSHNDA